MCKYFERPTLGRFGCVAFARRMMDWANETSTAAAADTFSGRSAWPAPEMELIPQPFEPLTEGNTAHALEYTLSNLRFAQAVEPGNVDLAAYQLRCVDLREHGKPTLPTSIALEQRINPFLRTRQDTVKAAARRFDVSARDDTTVFAAIRQWKNEYKS